MNDKTQLEWVAWNLEAMAKKVRGAQENKGFVKDDRVIVAERDRPEAHRTVVVYLLDKDSAIVGSKEVDIRKWPLEDYPEVVMKHVFVENVDASNVADLWVSVVGHGPVKVRPLGKGPIAKQDWGGVVLEDFVISL